MRIAFEVSSLNTRNPTGVSNFIKSFVDSFAKLDDKNSLTLYYKLTRIRHKHGWYRPGFAATKVYHNSLYPIFKNADIVHGLDCHVPNWKGSKRIVTFHDIFPLLNTDELISPVSFRFKKENEYREAVANSNLIVTNSENTKKDMVEYFGIDDSRVTTVYPGLDTEVFSKKDRSVIDPVLKHHGMKRDYLLFVGAVSGRKNTANLVEAYAASKARDEFDLVFAGPVSYKGEVTLETILRLELQDRVKILGYVPGEHLPALYSGAHGFLFPTFYEGFGFPILESMLCETPVLTSNVGSAPEIGGKFAKYVDPMSIDSIAAGIDELVEDTSFDPVPGREHAKQFTWDKTAKKMMGIYEAILH